MTQELKTQLLQANFYKWVHPDRLEQHFTMLRSKGIWLVATCGCFDILHAGHVRFFKEAFARGSNLTVLINSDESVSRLKGPGRPIVPLIDRMEVLHSIYIVGNLVILEEDTPEAMLELIRPHLWVKGGDYQHKELPERAVVEQYGGRVQILPYHAGHSTTSLWARMEDRAS